MIEFINNSFSTVMNLPFSELSLTLQSKLNANGISSFTPIQTQVIPAFLNSFDSLVALAPTGSGKTLSYVLPLLDYISKNPASSSLIVLPTRDLALQVLSVVNLYKSSSVYSVSVIGGTSIAQDIRNLSRVPNLIIGTPGRLIYHLNRLKGFNITHLIMDEVDRLLDQGFKKDYDTFIRCCTSARKVFFSATLSNKLSLKLAQQPNLKPRIIDCTLSYHEKDSIEQSFVNYQVLQKYNALCELLKSSSSSVVFMNSKAGVNTLSKKLASSGFTVFSYTSNQSVSRRAKVLSSFNHSPGSCLVATDIAARGIDFKSLDLVVNYQVPFTPSNYVHRIGRTGRAFNFGKAITFVSKAQQKYVRNIQKFKTTNQQILIPRTFKKSPRKFFKKKK